MRNVLYASAIAAMIVVGCSSATRNRLKHFFFEVPENSKTAPAVTGSDPSATQKTPELVLPEPRFVSNHPPYMQRLCFNCHDIKARMKVRDDFFHQCASCHKDFYSDRVGHPPVADHQCLVCHLPHRSEQKFLLVMPVFDVCVDCHDEPEDLSEEAHGGDNAEQCTACHDPHFGARPLLRESYRKSHGDED